MVYNLIVSNDLHCVCHIIIYYVSIVLCILVDIININ